MEMGPGAKEKYGLKVGDKAIAEVIMPCGECYFCRHGRYNLCDAPGIIGLNGPDGGWAEYIKLTKGSIVWKVPNELPWDVAIAIEPLACGIHGAERANIQFGENVVLAGVGISVFSCSRRQS